jgi:putative heme iron utilization protein
MSAVQREAMALVEAQRWAALAVSEADGPSASMVAYALDVDRASLVIFVSHLARHTQVLIDTGRAAVVIAAPDTGDGDPQQLPRASLRCRVDVPDRGGPVFAQAGARYVQRFPQALPRFELADFVLIRLVPEEVRYVGGFARAATFTWEQLRATVA